ncbi:MAG: hypothetical protein AAFV43_16075 [Planctomycetota bacterium]
MTAAAQQSTGPATAGDVAGDLSARLADVRVSVRPDLQVSRHNFGDAPAYVLRDPITNQTHRLSIDDYHVFAHIDTSRTLGETFRLLCKQGRVQPADAPRFYRYVLHLQQVGLLALPVSDGKSLHERHQKRRQAATAISVTKLLFYRVPLVRPDAFLERTVNLVAPLFTWTAFVIWAVLMLAAGSVVAIHRSEFVDPLAGMLAIRNLPVLWVLLVGLKLLHEMGHAWACKRFGGDVPEMGAFFIMGTPCAYVDATASWGFPSRKRRIIVALAGMYFESFAMIGAIAVWLVTDPGIVNSAAQYAVVLSTVVTIGFNANPLMRYDGYYVASDLLNIPNLRQESQNELYAWLKRVLFGVPIPPASETRQQTLLFWFGLASRVYMTTVILGIAWLVATCIPIVGPAIAVSIVGSTIVTTAKSAWQYLSTHDELVRRRERAWAVVIGGAVTASLVIGAIPTPTGVDTLGSIQREHERVVHAGVSGFLESRSVDTGDTIAEQQTVCTLRNPDAIAEVGRLGSELMAVRAQTLAAAEAPAEAGRFDARSTNVRSRLREARRLAAETTATAQISGQVVDASGLERVGRYVRLGEPLATIGAGGWVVRSLLTDEGVSDSRPAVGDQVRVRLIGRPGDVLQGTVVSVKAAGSRQVADPALTHLAGGDITVTEDMVADRAFFEVVLRLDDRPDCTLRRGMTAIIDFGGRPATIAAFLWRRGQQLVNRMRVES